MTLQTSLWASSGARWSGLLLSPKLIGTGNIECDVWRVVKASTLPSALLIRLTPTDATLTLSSIERVQ